MEFATGAKVEDFHAHADIIPVRGFEGCRYAEVTMPERLGPVPPLLAHLLPDFDWLAGATLKVGVAHGTANAKKVLDDIKAGGRFSQCHFIEFMACPGGCLGGGGQPRPTSAAIRKARAAAIYGEDAAYGQQGLPRKSHENKAVLAVYADFLGQGPGGSESHRLLHTHYTPRGKFIG
jgi:NADH-quinone oxidoreductase subunit G/[NiFe] hydrogenase diaphorase moiety small subunit